MFCKEKILQKAHKINYGPLFILLMIILLSHKKLENHINKSKISEITLKIYQKLRDLEFYFVEIFSLKYLFFLFYKAKKGLSVIPSSLF